MLAIANSQILSSLTNFFASAPRQPHLTKDPVPPAANTPSDRWKTLRRRVIVAPYRSLVESACADKQCSPNGQPHAARFQDALHAMTPRQQKAARQAYDYFFENLRNVEDRPSRIKAGEIIKTRRRLPHSDMPLITDFYEVGGHKSSLPQIAQYLRTTSDDRKYGMPFMHVAFREPSKMGPQDCNIVAMCPGIEQVLPKDKQPYGGFWRCTLASRDQKYLGLTVKEYLTENHAPVKRAVYGVCAGHIAFETEFHVRSDMKIVKNLGKEFWDMLQNLPIDDQRWHALYRQPSVALWPLLDGLQKMHQSGLVHGDLKPENVFMPENYFKISDFGCARSVNDISDMKGSLSYFDPKFFAEWYHARPDCSGSRQEKKPSPIGQNASVKINLNDVKALTKLQDIQNAFIVSLMGYAAGHWLAKRPNSERGVFTEIVKKYFRDRSILKDYAARDPDKIYPAPWPRCESSDFRENERMPFSDAYDALYMADAKHHAQLSEPVIQKYKKKTIQPAMHEQFDLLMEDIMQFHARHQSFDFTTMLVAG